MALSVRATKLGSDKGEHVKKRSICSIYKELLVKPPIQYYNGRRIIKQQEEVAWRDEEAPYGLG